ncbi:MAG: DUF937 domain-containing protein [Candidatus Binatia bacterium]
MATNLFEITKSVLTPEIIQKIGALIGESPTTTQRAVDTAVPSVFAGILHYVSSSAEGVGRLVRILDQGNYGQLLGNLNNLLGGGEASQTLMNSGKEFQSTLFGSRTNAVTDLIANNSGMNSTAVSSLLGVATPLLFGVLGRERSTQGLTPAGLISLLLVNRGEIARLAPPGLAGILGIANLQQLGANLTDASLTAATSPRTTTSVAVTSYEEESSIGKWLVPLLIAGLLVPWFIFVRGCGGPPTPPAVASHETTPAPHPAPDVKSEAALTSPPVPREETATPPSPEPTPATQEALASESEQPVPVGKQAVDLPSGKKLGLDEHSITYKLAKFLADAGDTEVPRTFTFDHLNFVFGTTEITLESEQTVKDLVAILKAYPSTKTQLEGHTDIIGDPAANKRLSQGRADAVKDYLVRNGIDESRLSAVGHGQEKPVASNDTAEGRAQNRRLELVVVKK